MMGADFFSYLENSPDTKTELLNMCRKRFFKKAVKKYALEHNRGFSNEDLIKAFELADSDKNGKLELEEVRKLMHAMDPTMSEEDIVDLMKYIDVGEEGKLTFRVSDEIVDIINCFIKGTTFCLTCSFNAGLQAIIPIF